MVFSQFLESNRYFWALTNYLRIISPYPILVLAPETPDMRHFTCSQNIVRSGVAKGVATRPNEGISEDVLI